MQVYKHLNGKLYIHKVISYYREVQSVKIEIKNQVRNYKHSHLAAKLRSFLD